jgi:4-amino-4-deoxy-L-arabinose transferase-like glycosyltransferase
MSANVELSGSGADARDPTPFWSRIGAWPGALLLFLLALVIRLLWWHFGPQVIESEGVYYARVGENLAAGRGLVGIHEMGLQLLYPPLYASLIAAGVRLGLSAETAGRTVSLLFGSGLAAVVFMFARRYYSTAAGWLAGLLAATHPLLVVASTAVLTESTNLTLMVLAIYFMIDVLALGKWRSVVLGAICLGLAYLVRPEAFILAWAFAFLVIAVNLRQWKPAAVRSGVLLGVFAVFAIPYILFLWQQTGQLRFEAKTADGVRYAQRELAGQSASQIYFAIDKNLLERGASNVSDLEMLQTTHASLPERVRMTVRQAIQNLPRLLRGFGDLQFGAPLLTVLAALGLFAVPWDLLRLRRELPLLAVTGFTLLTFCTWPFFHDRFLFALLAGLVVWGGVGLAWLGTWTKETAQQLRLPGTVSRFAVACVLCLSIALVGLAGMLGVPQTDEMSQSWMVPSLRDDVAVGHWLGSQATRARLMDTGPTAAFYAGAVLVPFPWTDSATALRYIEHKHVQFLILREADRKRRPYLTQWWEHDPSDRFELIKSFSGQGGATRIYRWRSASSNP